jgi:hypothetical protein
MKATIALNYQGLGLPTYLWEDFANLLSRTAHIVQSDLLISRTTGLYYLNGHCKNTDYDDLWHYYFKVQMANGTNTNFLTVPLASLAHYDNATGTCQLYVQLLNDHMGLPETSNVVLGSMFMQNF